MTTFNKEEKRLLLELIGNEQIHMIIRNHTMYESDDYRKLEALKVKIKDLEEDGTNELDCFGDFDENSFFCKEHCQKVEKCKSESSQSQ